MKKIKDFIINKTNSFKEDKASYSAVKYCFMMMGVLGLSLLFAYALYLLDIIGEGRPNTLQVANLDITFTDTADINLTTELPIYDSMKETDAYTNTFKMSNFATSGSNVGAEYEIYLNLTSIDTILKNSYMKWEILNNDVIVNSGNLTNFNVGDNLLTPTKHNLPLNDTQKWTFRLWMTYDDNVDQMYLLNHSLSGTLKVKSNEKRMPSKTTAGNFASMIMVDNVPNSKKIPFADDGFSSTTTTKTVTATERGYYITYADDKTFNEETGKYTLTGIHVGLYSEVYSNLENKYIISNPFSSSSVAQNCENKIYIYELTNVTSSSYEYKVPITVGSLPGVNLATTDEGLIEQENDDYGNKTYYFRGDVQNNYVSFAGKTWRIVRINGDNSIRLVLNTSAGLSVWNTNYTTSTQSTAISYVTYGNSTIKTSVDAWYNDNIGNNPSYESKVATSKFCNDKTLVTQQPGTTQYNFGATVRLNNPTFVCPQSTDIYNLKVGLLTADEILFAGRLWFVNSTSYYLYHSNVDMWSMSPSIWITTLYTFLNSVEGNPNYTDALNVSNGIFPVISLSSDVLATVDPEDPGTIDNPYIVD